MKTRNLVVLSSAVAVLLTLPTVNALAQPASPARPVTFIERNLGGPRLGITFSLGSSEYTEKLKEFGLGNTLSQFGWHFEYQVIPEGGGPQFVIQFTPLLGGVEYGKIIPSATLAMGVRFPGGFEFGMGPNLVATPDGIASALVIGIGKSFDYGGVSIPINLALTHSTVGDRISIIFGYAIEKAR